ncbi:acyltransferase [bacterium]|nr:acyltransferase [bacterium]
MVDIVDTGQRSRVAMVGDWLYSKLSRVTSSGQLIREIDGLRFIAITAVVVCHINTDLIKATYGHYPATVAANGFFNWLFSNGSIGVHLFFVISGFVLALPFAQHYLCKKTKPKLGRYFLRRVTRLEPPYILNLLFLAVMRVAIMGDSPGAVLPHLAASIGYVHNIIYQSMSTINQVAWSLEIEVQFYVLAPLIAKMFLIRGTAARRLAIVGMAAVFTIAQNLIPVDSWFFNHFNMSIIYKMQYFLMGFLLVDIYLLNWKSQPEKCRAWDVVSALCWLGIIPVLRFGAFVEYLVPALIVIAYIGAFRGRLMSRLLSSRFFVVCGGMCYTLYLYHGKIAYALMPKLLHLPHTGLLMFDVPMLVILAYVPILAICALLFALIEKPCMRPDWPTRLKGAVLRCLSANR